MCASASSRWKSTLRGVWRTEYPPTGGNRESLPSSYGSACFYAPHSSYDNSLRTETISGSQNGLQLHNLPSNSRRTGRRRRKVTMEIEI